MRKSAVFAAVCAALVVVAGIAAFGLRGKAGASARSRSIAGDSIRSADDPTLVKVQKIIMTIQANKRAGADAAGRSSERRFELTEAEINAYIKFWIQTHGGKEGIEVRSAALHFLPGNVVAAEAVAGIGAGPVAQLGSESSAPFVRTLLRLLDADNSVRLECQAEAKDGKLSLAVRSLKIKSFALPVSLVRRILEVVGRKQRPPVDLTRPFDLPNGIENAQILDHAVRIDVRLVPKPLPDDKLAAETLRRIAQRHAVEALMERNLRTARDYHTTSELKLSPLNAFLSKRFAVALLILIAAVRRYKRLRFGDGGTGWRVLRDECAGALHRTAAELLFSRDLHLGCLLFAAGFMIARSYVALALAAPGAFFYPPTSGWVVLPLWRYGLLLGTAAALVYGIFRMGMNRAISVIGSLAVCTSPFQLYFLVSSPARDFHKAPIALGILLLFGLIVRRARTLISAGLLASAVGLTIALGLFVREDLPVFLLPAALIVVFLTPYAVPQSGRLKAAGLLCLLLTFSVFTPLPVMQAISLNTADSIVSHFDGQLGLTRPSYDLGYMYNDAHAAAQASLALAPNYPEVQVSSAPGLVPYYMLEDTGGSIMKRYVIGFPADFAVRVYASALTLLRLPYVYHLPPQGLRSALLLRLYAARARVQDLLAGKELALFAAATLLLAATNLRLALLQVLVLFFCAGLFTCQFLGKHFFYMEYFSLWSLGLLAQQALALGRRLRGGRSCAGLPVEKWDARAPALLGCVAALGFLVPLALARRSQAAAVKRLMSEYQQAPSDSDAARRVAVKDGGAFLGRPALSTQTIGGAEFLRADFSREGCPTSTLWPVFRYRGAWSLDWSRTVRVTIPESAPGASFFFPAWSPFAGIELPSEQAGCLRGISRVANPLRFPLLPSALVPPGPGPLYQRLDEWEGGRFRSSLGEFSRSVRLPGNGARQTPVSAGDIGFLAPIVRQTAGGWEVRGYAAPGVDVVRPLRDRSRSRLAQAWTGAVSDYEVDTDILVARPKRLRKGSYVFVEGELYAGGFTAGLVKGDRSAGSVSFSTPGRFAAFLPVTADGDYVFGIANKLQAFTYLENRFTVKTAVYGVMP